MSDRQRNALWQEFKNHPRPRCEGVVNGQQCITRLSAYSAHWPYCECCWRRQIVELMESADDDSTTPAPLGMPEIDIFLDYWDGYRKLCAAIQRCPEVFNYASVKQFVRVSVNQFHNLIKTAIGYGVVEDAGTNSSGRRRYRKVNL